MDVDFDVRYLRDERWDVITEALKLLAIENPGKLIDGNRIKMTFINKKTHELNKKKWKENK